MRVGIITYNRVWNYGAALQCVALYNKLSELGHDVYVVDYHPRYAQHTFVYQNPFIKAREGWSYNREGSFAKRVKGAVRWFCGGVLSYTTVNKRKVISAKFNHFVENNTKLTRKYHSEKMIKKNPPGMDVLVCGSDQIWNPIATRGVLDSVYYLQFGGENIRRVAYAASACKLIPEKFENELKEYLSKFDFISLRENDKVEALSKISSKRIGTCIDPTLLYDAQFYCKHEIPVVGLENRKYILTYFLGMSEMSTRKYVETYLGLVDEDISSDTLIVDMSSETTGKNNMFLDEIGPGEFLWLINHSEYVITNSFHAMVFSILYHKNFLVLPRDNMNSRVVELSERLGVQNKLISSQVLENKNKEIMKASAEYKINYSSVDDKLRDIRMQNINIIEERMLVKI